MDGQQVNVFDEARRMITAAEEDAQALLNNSRRLERDNKILQSRVNRQQVLINRINIAVDGQPMTVAELLKHLTKAKEPKSQFLAAFAKVDNQQAYGTQAEFESLRSSNQALGHQVATLKEQLKKANKVREDYWRLTNSHTTDHSTLPLRFEHKLTCEHKIVTSQPPKAIKTVCCLVCNTHHDETGESFFTIYGNIMVGLHGGVLGNNFGPDGTLKAAQVFCRHDNCLARFLNQQ